jgi:hypothetical protein
MQMSTSVNCCSGTLVTYTFTIKVEVWDAAGNPCEAGINICPPSNVNIEACRTPGPTGSGTLFGSFNPDPSGFLARLNDKVPFAYISQVQDSLQGAVDAPGGATPDLCQTFDLFGESHEFCIPTAPFDYLADWRWLQVGLVWLGGALALWRIIGWSVGMGSGGSDE